MKLKHQNFITKPNKIFWAVSTISLDKPCKCGSIHGTYFMNDFKETKIICSECGKLLKKGLHK